MVYKILYGYSISDVHSFKKEPICCLMSISKLVNPQRHGVLRQSNNALPPMCHSIFSASGNNFSPQRFHKNQITQ